MKRRESEREREGRFVSVGRKNCYRRKDALRK
jgi:hypothetical protein